MRQLAGTSGPTARPLAPRASSGAVLAAALACAVMLGALPAGAAESVQCVITALKGKVTLQHMKTKPAAAQVGDFMYPDDTIVTGPDGLASLALTGGTEVRVNNNSTFKMAGPSPGSQKVQLGDGQVWSKLLHKRSELHVHTTNAVAAVRGTEADINNRGALTVKVYEGHVDLINPFGRVTLNQGQTSRVSGPSAAPEPPRTMTGDDRESWQDQIQPDEGARDQQLERLEGQAGQEEKTLRLKLEKDGEQKTIRIKFKKGQE